MSVFKSRKSFPSSIYSFKFKFQDFFFSEEKIPAFDIHLNQKDILNRIHEIDNDTSHPPSKQANIEPKCMPAKGGQI